MTRIRILLLGGVLLLGFLPRVAHAAAPDYCDGPPAGVVGYHGTITVHAGIPHPCVVNIVGGAVFQAGGGTAPQKPGARAVFRVTGYSIDAPGAVTIVAGASLDPGSAPETLPLRNPAKLILAPGTVLVRYDFARDKYVAVPDDKIRLAFVPYKIIRRGAMAMLQPAPSHMPAALPATGVSPLSALSPVAAALLLFGVGRARGATRPRRRRARVTVLTAAGALLLAAGGTLAYMSLHAASAGFGSLAAAGPSPRQAGAAGPPTRLVIPALGIDTRLTALGIAGGAWQDPAYGAGYLSGSAWPGHAGNEGIAGHDDTEGAVFRRLSSIHAGDEVRVYAGTRAYRYRVTAMRVVLPSRVDVLRPTHGATLTLITCTPYLVDTNRLVVRAELVS